MHLLNEIFQALLIYLSRVLGFFTQYARALIGGQRATLLARLGTAIGLAGGAVLYASMRLDSVLRVAVEAAGYGVLSLSAFLLIIAFPDVKRFWGYGGLAAALALVAAYFLGLGDTGLLMLSAALSMISISALFIDDRYLCGSIRGMVAEWRVHNTLSRFKKRGGGLIANAVFSQGEKTTEVDHILVTHAGVFVIETKGLSGVIAGDPDADFWRQILRKTDHQFFNPIKQNEIHVNAVTRLVGEGIPVHNVVVFTSAKFATPMPPNVLHIGHLARYLKQFRGKALNSHLIKTITARIEAAVDTSREARDAHIRRLASRRLTEYAD